MQKYFKYFNTKIIPYFNITLVLTSSIYNKYKNYDFALNYRSRNSIKGHIRHHSRAFAIHNIPNPTGTQHQITVGDAGLDGAGAPGPVGATGHKGICGRHFHHEILAMKTLSGRQALKRTNTASAIKAGNSEDCILTALPRSTDPPEPSAGSDKQHE